MRIERIGLILRIAPKTGTRFLATSRKEWGNCRRTVASRAAVPPSSCHRERSSPSRGAIRPIRSIRPIRIASRDGNPPPDGTRNRAAGPTSVDFHLPDAEAQVLLLHDRAELRLHAIRIANSAEGNTRRARVGAHDLHITQPRDASPERTQDDRVPNPPELEIVRDRGQDPRRNTQPL